MYLNASGTYSSTHSQACAHHQLWPELPSAPVPRLVVPLRTLTPIANTTNNLQFLLQRIVQLSVLWKTASWANETKSLALQTWRYHMPPRLTPYTTRPKTTECSSMPWPTSEGFFLLKSVHKIWKRGLLLYMCRCMSQGNMSPPKKQTSSICHKRNGDSPIVWRIIQNNYSKESHKRIQYRLTF